MSINPELRITVAIATYNRSRFLPGLFDSLLAQTLGKEQFEVLFIDNNSTDDSATLCHHFINLHPEYSFRYMVEKNQGLSYGRNRGIREAKAPYITFADDDAIMAPDFLKEVVKYLDSNPSVGEVGGPIYLNYLATQPRWSSSYLSSLFGYFCPSKRSFDVNRKNRFYPRGSNMTFRTELLRRIGGFNVRLGRIKGSMIGGEEKEIAYRLLDMGVRITYQPHLVVHHLVPQERTTVDFIRRQAIGIGRSERIRSQESKEYVKRMMIELGKWGATLLLYVYYGVRCQPSKGAMLVRFRRWITDGLIGSTNE